MPGPADQPVRHGRNLIGFYIAMGVTLLLVALGTWLYRPLKLRYALYQVHQAASGERAFRKNDQEWIDTCIDAACRGNEPAIEAAIDVAGFEGPCLISRCTAAYRVASTQPDAFFRALGRREDMRVVQVVEDIANACAADQSGNFLSYGQGYPSVDRMITAFEGWANSSDSQVKQVAASTLEFLHRRRPKGHVESKVGRSEL